MATKAVRRRDLEVHLGSGGQIVGRLHLGSGKRSAFSYDERWLRDARSSRCRVNQEIGYACHRSDRFRAGLCLGIFPER